MLKPKKKTSTNTIHRPNIESRALTFVGHVHEVLDVLFIGR
jgi:hypothetical protein